MAYVDRTLTCVDCGAEFVHSAEDQEYYATKGFVSDPKRCPSCRATQAVMRESGEMAAPRQRPERRTARVFRGRLLALRQPGPGAVQAAHGPAGLLLRLLPRGPRPGRLASGSARNRKAAVAFRRPPLRLREVQAAGLAGVELLIGAIGHEAAPPPMTRTSATYMKMGARSRPLRELHEQRQDAARGGGSREAQEDLGERASAR